MINFFESIKQSILQKFKPKKSSNECIKNQNYKYHCEEQVILLKEDGPTNICPKSSNPLTYNDETSEIYIEDTSEKRLFNTERLISQRYNNNILINISYLPMTYLIVSISAFVGMLIISSYKDLPKSLYNQVGPNKYLVINYFEICKINPLVYHLFQSCTSFLGIFIVTMLFFSIKSKSKNFYQNSGYLQIYLSCVFGIISFILLLVEGVMPLLGDVGTYNALLKSEIGINLPNFVFLTRLFFSLLFMLTFLLVVWNLNLNYDQSEESEMNNTWFNYKLITLIYLGFFTFIYVFVLLHHNKIIFSEFSLATNYNYTSYILTIFPYLLHCLNDLMIFTFSFELRLSNITLTEIENESIIRKTEKNIL